MKIDRIGSFRLKRGEGPVWDVPEQALYLVDSLAHRVLRYDPATAELRDWHLDAQIGSLAVLADGKPIVALGKHVIVLDTETGAREVVATIEQHDPVS